MKEQLINVVNASYICDKVSIKLERLQHRNDSVGWIVKSLLLIFISCFSVIRLTLIGQFIDDVIFTFIFGWFKYVIYLFLILYGIFAFLSVKVRIDRKVRCVFLVFVMLFLWFISNFILIFQYFKGDISFFSSIGFINIISDYIRHWKQSSIFGISPINLINFGKFNGKWITFYIGGGIIGGFIAAVFSYSTIFGSFVFNIISFMFLFSWIFTGSAIGMFCKFLNKKNLSNKIRETFYKDKVNNNINFINDDMMKSNRFLLSPELAINDEKKLNIVDYNNNDVNFGLRNRYLKSSLFFEPIIIGKLDEIKQSKIKKTYYFPQKYKYFKKQFYDKLIDNNSNDNLPYSSVNSVSNYYNYNNHQNLIDEARKKFNFDTNITPFGRFNKNAVFINDVDNSDSFKKASILESDINVIESINNNDIDKFFFDKNNIKNYNVYNNNDELIKNNDISNLQYKNFYNLNDENVYLDESYRLPLLSFLNKNGLNIENNNINSKVASEKAAQINNLFRQFEISASVENINIGPKITKFEIYMKPGIKINKIIGLENDLKYALATQNIRIEAPIQGKSAVGIEIANKISSIVTLRELFEKLSTSEQNKKLLIAIGKNSDDDIVFIELNKMPHLLISGSTGSGKSMCINIILCSLLLKVKPCEVKLLLIDPKHVELAIYDNLPHLITPVIYDVKLAKYALKNIIVEMEKRYKILSSKGAKNIEVYNNKVTLYEKLPYIIIVIDELADLMFTAGKEIEDLIMKITQLARAAGIHMIVATQRPSIDVITGAIKTNIPSRISFSVVSSVDSRTILGKGGAEKLIGNGDMLYMFPGQTVPIRGQCAFISDKEIEKIVNYCKIQQKPRYRDEFLIINSNSINFDEEEGVKDKEIFNKKDPLYNEIKRFIIVNQKASASLIQRKFFIGYNRASRLMDLLEKDGIVGPQQNGVKSREVFVKNLI